MVEIRRTEVRRPKFCLYCKEGIVPSYLDSATLRKFVTDRGKISSKQRSGLCSKHQRKTAREVKRARYLALLPYSVKI